MSMPVLHGSKVFFSYLVFSCKIFMLSGQEILLLKHVLLVQKILGLKWDQCSGTQRGEFDF